MSTTIVNVTAATPATGTSGFSLSDTAVGIQEGATFGAAAPSSIDGQALGSLYYQGVAIPSTLNLTINQDWIDDGTNFAGLNFSQLLTGPQQAAYQAGTITTVNISGSGSPARGYWVISGFATTPTIPGQTIAGGPGFVIDLDSPSNVTFNIDTSILRVYGAGGNGGDALDPFISPGGPGGDAIQLFGGFANLDLNVTNQVGASIGKIIAGGGGGNAGSHWIGVGYGADRSGGGGGAAGWNPGIGGPASGTTPSYPGNNGGVYDANNGGADDASVAGGSSGIGNPPVGDGGNLATDGNASNTLPGAGGIAGLAVNRFGQTGATTIISGGGPTNIIGTVQ